MSKIDLTIVHNVKKVTHRVRPSHGSMYLEPILHLGYRTYCGIAILKHTNITNQRGAVTCARCKRVK